MKRAHDPEGRRRLLRGGLGLAVLGSGGALAGCAGGRGHLSGYEDALRTLDFYAAAGDVRTRGAWNAAQVFAHCAQSIEYSMQGFPDLKPALFRATVGAAAAGVFAAWGQMRHDLAEPIPGAAPLDAGAPVGEALARLRRAFETFQTYNGPLRPHFAYGELPRGDYLFAHVLHLDNHLDEFSPLPPFLQPA